MSDSVSPPQGYKRVPIDRGFAALIGPSYYREEDGRLFYRFATGPEHANIAGLVHGGLLMTLADNILGGTVWRAIDRLRCVTVSLNTDFVSGARPGDWIDGEAEITRKTRNLVFVSGRLSVEGRTVLNASGIWKILRPKTPS